MIGTSIVFKMISLHEVYTVDHNILEGPQKDLAKHLIIEQLIVADDLDASRNFSYAMDIAER
jgi:hypothetical protein